jgi:hypothetical protein
MDIKSIIKNVLAQRLEENVQVPQLPKVKDTNDYVKYLAEAIQYRLEEKEVNDLAEGALIFCEQNEINFDSLNEEQLNELFGAIKRMGQAAKRGLSGASKIVKDGIRNTGDAMTKSAETAWNASDRGGGMGGFGKRTGAAIGAAASEAGKRVLSGGRKLAKGAIKTAGSMGKAALINPVRARSNDQAGEIRKRMFDRARQAAAKFNGSKGLSPGIYGESTELAGNKLDELSIETLKSYKAKASAQDSTTTPMKREKGIGKATTKIDIAQRRKKDRGEGYERGIHVTTPDDPNAAGRRTDAMSPEKIRGSGLAGKTVGGKPRTERLAKKMAKINKNTGELLGSLADKEGGSGRNPKNKGGGL